jgi:hypothetical protein
VGLQPDSFTNEKEPSGMVPRTQLGSGAVKPVGRQ